MITKSFETYQNNSVNTASGPQLTMMLYNGCIKFIKYGIKATEDHNYEMKNTNIQKAQNIIQELMLTLDQSVEISKEMLSLYEYIHYQLQNGNIKNDVASMQEALEYVTDFRDTWKEAMKQTSTSYRQGSRV